MSDLSILSTASLLSAKVLLERLRRASGQKQNSKTNSIINLITQMFEHSDGIDNNGGQQYDQQNELSQKNNQISECGQPQASPLFLNDRQSVGHVIDLSGQVGHSIDYYFGQVVGHSLKVVEVGSGRRGGHTISACRAWSVHVARDWI